MREIDKSVFAAFLSQHRKEKGLTQKDLAQRLYVSDKAVSKWERGLSMPDIALLIPLSEILGVTVTELLEGRKLEAEEITTEQAEVLLQKALSLSEDSGKSDPKKAWPMLLAIGIAALEILIVWKFFGGLTMGASFYVFEGLNLFFGIYFWFFLAEHLPSYYDENEIGFYSDGILKMNLPGIAFNNTNWPRIVKVLRLWSLISLVTVLPVGVLLELLPTTDVTNLMLQMVCLLLYLGSLFAPVYLCARKSGKTMGKERQKILITMVVLFCILPFLSQGSFRSGTRIGYFENRTGQTWSANYVCLDGWMQRSLNPQNADYLIQVTTRDGSLSIDLTDEDGLVFSETNLPTGTYPVTLDGKIRVTVKAEEHNGSFSIAPAQ